MVDIERNFDNIVKRMEMKPFGEIMGRYDRKAEEHAKILEQLVMNYSINELAVISKETLEQEITSMCERVLNSEQTIKSQPQVPNNNDFRFLEVTDETYHLSCANSLQRTHSNMKLNKHSPMRLPPFPKSLQNYSRKDSGVNTPDSTKGPRHPANNAPTTP